MARLRSSWAWLSWSLVVHAVVIAALAWSPPASEQAATRQRLPISGERLGEVAEHLRRQRLAELERHLERLRELEAELRETAAAETPSAPEGAAGAGVDAVLALQRSALADLAAARGAAASGDPQASGHALAAALQDMSGALELLARLDAEPELLRLQAAVLSARAHARVAQGAWAEAAGSLRDRRQAQREARAREIEAARAQVEAAHEQLAASDDEAERTRLEADLAAARARLQERRDAADAPDPPADDELRELTGTAIAEAISAQEAARNAVMAQARDLRERSPAPRGAALGLGDDDDAGAAVVERYREAVASEQRIGAQLVRAVATGGTALPADLGAAPLIERPSLDSAAIAGSVTTEAEFQRLVAELDRAVRAGAAMAQRAEASLALLREGAGPGGLGAASGDGSGLAVVAGGATADREGDGDPGTDDTGLAGTGSEPVADLTALLWDRYGDPDMPRERLSQQPPSEVVMSPETVALGRTLAVAEGSGKPWLAVDSWYTIGPFPNPDRRNIDRTFPPESVIDLGARYPGKHGEVGWHFVQSPHPGIVPVGPEPYSVYYATTEIWAERATELWIALGSDDHGTVWLNGVRIWTSPSFQKGWDPGEAYRRVLLRRGRNRILYRIENGHFVVRFSLMLHLGPARTGFVD